MYPDQKNSLNYGDGNQRHSGYHQQYYMNSRDPRGNGMNNQDMRGSYYSSTRDGYYSSQSQGAPRSPYYHHPQDHRSPSGAPRSDPRKTYGTPQGYNRSYNSHGSSGSSYRQHHFTPTKSPGFSYHQKTQKKVVDQVKPLNNKQSELLRSPGPKDLDKKKHTEVSVSKNIEKKTHNETLKPSVPKDHEKTVCQEKLTLSPPKDTEKKNSSEQLVPCASKDHEMNTPCETLSSSAPVCPENNKPIESLENPTHDDMDVKKTVEPQISTILEDKQEEKSIDKDFEQAEKPMTLEDPVTFKDSNVGVESTNHPEVNHEIIFEDKAKLSTPETNGICEEISQLPPVQETSSNAYVGEPLQEEHLDCFNKTSNSENKSQNEDCEVKKPQIPEFATSSTVIEVSADVNSEENDTHSVECANQEILNIKENGTLELPSLHSEATCIESTKNEQPQETSDIRVQAESTSLTSETPMNENSSTDECLQKEIEPTSSNHVDPMLPEIVESIISNVMSEVEGPPENTTKEIIPDASKQTIGGSAPVGSPVLQEKTPNENVENTPMKKEETDIVGKLNEMYITPSRSSRKSRALVDSTNIVESSSIAYVVREVKHKEGTNEVIMTPVRRSTRKKAITPCPKENDQETLRAAKVVPNPFLNA